MTQVEGARIVVVGGVRRLGRELALDLAAHGAAVCVTSRATGAETEAVVRELAAAGAANAAAIQADVRVPDAGAALIAAAGAALGGLDAVVYAASGPFAPMPPQEISEAAWNASFETIAKGFFTVACAARNEFVRQAKGRTGSAAREAGVLIAITDHLGLHPWTAFAAHGAAKAAQIHLVRQLARAWAPDGVRVCGVAPGPVDLKDDEHRAATLRATASAAAPRLVAAADIGRAVRFCLETDGVTGINIPVDNGALLTR